MVFRLLSTFSLLPGTNSSKPTTRDHGLTTLGGEMRTASVNKRLRAEECSTRLTNKVLGSANSQSTKPPSMRGMDSMHFTLSNLSAIMFDVTWQPNVFNNGLHDYVID